MSRKNWHSLSTEETIKVLKTDPDKGLSKEEAIKRKNEFGSNNLPEKKSLSKVRIFLEQFKNALIYILVIAGTITLFFELYTDAIVIFLAVILNTVIGYIQENKANQALRELRKIVKIEARVIREGKEIKIDAQELVPGDLIVLSAGAKVPADARLIESHDLRINESPLTGEWLTAQKITSVLTKETPLADRDNMAYTGCMIENGKGKALVTEIGPETEVGKVAALVKETEESQTPLQKKISLFSRKIGLAVVIVCIFIFLGGILEQQPALEMFTTAVAVAVAAVPEGLPIAMTVILALGMLRILNGKGLVRKLIAAETLGSTSVIATDKTLTLTEGKMEVSKISSLNNEISFDSEIDSESFKKQALEEDILSVNIATLCSEAFIENPQDVHPLWKIQGGPTDKAFVLVGAQLGFRKPELEEKFRKLDEIPFDSKNKFIASLYQKDKENILYVSGAPEKVLSLSSYIFTKGKKENLDQEKKNQLKEKLEKLAKKGLRVVALAYKEVENYSDNYCLKKEIKGLTFTGFISLKDPVRKEAKEAIKTCIQAGMRPIIVTGDHKFTAQAVAEEIGLKVKEKNIIEGIELDQISDEEFEKRLEDLYIYARVEARHKLKIISAWQKKGEVVAMTGDGINDTPALKKADIGIALGSGTDTAKEVSDLILLTDNFNVIMAAIEEGRAIIDNIRKVITYLFSSAFTEVLLVSISILLGYPLAISAVQILWINLIEDGPLSLVLAFEPKEKDLMKQKPMGHDIPLLTKEMKTLIFIVGFITDLLLISLFIWLFKFSGYEIPHIRSVIFAGLAIDSIFYIFACKSLRKNIWHINLSSNKFLIIAWIISLLALISALYLPALQTLLKTIPLTFFDWQMVLGLGFLNLILIELTKWYFITRKQTT